MRLRITHGGWAFAVLLAFAVVAAETPLLDAVKRGDRSSALAHATEKIDVTAGEPDGTTALHWAARQDDLELADRLFKGGADAQPANRHGSTPLSLAARDVRAA